MDKEINLSEFFVTKKQANDFIQGLNNIVNQLFEVNFNLESALINEFGIDKKDKFMILLRDSKMNSASNDQLKNFLTSLQDSIRNLPVITITIAYEPNEASLKAFLEWFMFNLKKQILLDLQVNKKLIAGATINYNGKFKDYSIKSLFDQINTEGTKLNSNKNQTVNQNKIA